MSCPSAALLLHDVGRSRNKAAAVKSLWSSARHVFDHLNDVDVPAFTTALQRFGSDNHCAEVERERDEP